MERDPLDQLLGGPDDSVVPRPEFSDALLGQLLVALGAEAAPPISESRTFVTRKPIHLPVAQILAESPPSGRNWRRSYGFAAAVALVVLVVVWFAVEPNDRESFKAIPAAVRVTESPVPVAVAKETLLELSLPASTLPPLTTGGSSLFQFTVPSGALWDWPAKTDDQCCRGIVLDYIISGSYTVRFPNDSVQIVQHGGPPETVASGTAITLVPGDALISWKQFAHHGVNNGPDPVQLLRWDFDGKSSSLIVPAHWIANADNPHFFLTPLDDGPVTVTILSVDLQPDQEFQVPSKVRDDLVFQVPMNVDADGVPRTSHVTNVGGGRILNFGSSPISVYVLTLESRATAATPGANAPTPEK